MASLLLVLFSIALPARAQDGPLTFDSIVGMAQNLAAQPFKELPSIEGEMRKLSYDQYRALRTRPEAVTWRDGKGLFRIEPFAAGFIYEKAVLVHIVEGDRATPLVVAPEHFDFGDTGLKNPPSQLALAGFKITHPLNRPDKFDEVISFLGASYFRAVGRGQVYGVSARGLAINTGIGKPEEFPAFRSFWIVQPKDDAKDITIWALLDSPSASGAYAFTVRPGGRTVIDSKLTLFLRNDVELLAVAPLTSMFFTGKSSPPRDDYRPEIHDSDGLYMATGGGERIWRQLVNPGALAISSFSDANPRGFGLMQRERDFVHYQDSNTRLERRPSFWVEPKGDWGDGEVRLLEIPTQSEVNDNIVAFWVSRWPAKKGERKDYEYRLSALADDPVLSPQGRVIATRDGALYPGSKLRRYAIEFAGGDLDAMAPEQPVEANVTLSSGKLLRTHVEALPWRKSWRLFIELEPDGKKPLDLRAFLTLREQRLSETWSATWRP